MKLLGQWYLTVFAPWTPELKEIKITTGGPLNTCKRGLKGYSNLLLCSSWIP